MNRVVELRAYNLKPGTRTAFHRLMQERSLPMLKRWRVDVVACGPSAHDEDSYYLIRAYASLEERQESQDAFYGSDEWIAGPREEVLAFIESYATAVVEMSVEALEALRREP
ncbi:MAG: NIPSNAP family protein [Rubrivivax sp.]|nr:NIPSNAP family protein [Pyrinomonadaceae bacterium]